MKVKNIISITLILAVLSPAVFAVDTLYDNRFKGWMEGAKKGDVLAQYSLGNAYLRGNEVSVDYNEAVHWFTEAAKKNHAKSQYKLGYLYYSGTGVRKDSSTAFNWFQKAASSGYAPAQYYLGKMYADGQGTSQNFDNALEWLNKAKSNDYSPSNREIARVENMMNEARQAAKQAARQEARKEAPPKVEQKVEKKVVRKEPPPQPKVQQPAEKTKVSSTSGHKPEVWALESNVALVSTGSNSKPAAEPKKPEAEIKKVVEKKAKAEEKKPEPKLEGTAGALVAGGWKLGDAPSEVFPSDLVNCTPKGDDLECKTEEITTTNPFAEIHYEMTSLMSRFNKKGDFLVKIRKNVTFVLPTDPDDPEPDPQFIPKLGQQPYRLMKCKLRSNNEIHCATDEFKIVDYKR